MRVVARVDLDGEVGVPVPGRVRERSGVRGARGRVCARARGRGGGRVGEEVEDERHGADEVEMDDCAPGRGFCAKGLRRELELEVAQDRRLS